MRTFTLIALALASASCISQDTWQERDALLPKKPITITQLREMVRLYKAYQLPLPPKGSQLVHIPTFYSEKGKYVAVPEDDGIAWLSPPNLSLPRPVFWGTTSITKAEATRYLPEGIAWKILEEGDPWLAAPRRLLSGPDHQRWNETLFVLTIQMAAFGMEALAMKINPFWYSRVTLGDGMWDDSWAAPEPCVANLAIAYAEDEWDHPLGDRRKAVETMLRAFGRRLFSDFVTYDAKVRSLRASLSSPNTNPESPEAAMVALVESKAFIGEDFRKSPIVQKLLSLGARAVPALLAHREDESETRVQTGGHIYAPEFGKVGEVVSRILAEIPEELRQSIEHKWRSGGPEGEAAYCRKNILPVPDGREAIPNPALLKVLAQHPRDLYATTLESIRTRPDVDPVTFLAALKNAEFSLREPAEMLVLQAVAKPQIYHHLALLRPGFEPSEALGSLLSLCPDEEPIWVLARTSLRSMAPAARAKLLERAMDVTGPNYKICYDLARACINDSSLLSAPELATFSPAIRNGLQPKFARVQNLAAMLLALEMSMITGDEKLSLYKERDWADLRKRVAAE